MIIYSVKWVFFQLTQGRSTTIHSIPQPKSLKGKPYETLNAYLLWKSQAEECLCDQNNDTQLQPLETDRS